MFCRIAILWNKHLLLYSILLAVSGRIVEMCELVKVRIRKGARLGGDSVLKLDAKPGSAACRLRVSSADGSNEKYWREGGGLSAG